ncbi:MAG: class I SAM-dependent methyltransferase [Opitutaceae bacterium]|nr:class I SAM-dependent methyltransferase [Opitutaceae bacterium]
MAEAASPSPERRELPPRNEFDEDAYLQLHADVAVAMAQGRVDSAWQHFTLHGFAEGRPWISKRDPLAGLNREIAPGDEMYFGNAEHYFDVGESALRCVESALLAVRRRKSAVGSILDLPCGYGRVLRFLRQAFPGAQLTACDLLRDGVEFCARQFGAVPVVSRTEPAEVPLSGGYDLIWCGSLLTHLPAARCAGFLQLFQRVLHPDGILVFTLHGRRCEAELATGRHDFGLAPEQATPLLAEYRRTGFGYVDYPGQPGYGISLARPSYVLEHFVQRPEWRLVGYHETAWDRRQDVVCLQKPVGSGPV